jgi:hypothetical protein
MKKIKIVLKKKSDFLEYHKILWNGIIKYIKEHGLLEGYSNGYKIKKKVYKELFQGEPIQDCCFGCEYTKFTEKPTCSGCLFEITQSCLDGNWVGFFNLSTSETAISFATKILNFPVKKS